VGDFDFHPAIDLIMPPLDISTKRILRIGDFDVDWLLMQLSGGEHTGCVKCATESRLSHSSMLLWHGRVVGCIYVSEQEPAVKSTEDALNSMLVDLRAPDTVTTVYELPEELTLAMSALFLGYPIERYDDYNSKEYLDYICNWLSQKSGTATLVISLSNGRGHCLVYIFNGKFAGVFHVQAQAYHSERAYIDEVLETDLEAALDVSILPPQAYTNAARFGFDLRMD